MAQTDSRASMRFTSLIVELIRSRPGLVVCVVLLVQASIWFAVPTIFYSSPAGDLATVLAYGREYVVGSALGPPLAFWLADLAFRAAGNHILGVYLLSQLCSVATFALLYQLGRAIVGGPHAVLAVLLTMTIVAFGWPAVEFGPRVLAQPIWAWVLLTTWQIVGQGRRGRWFALALAAGVLLLTTPDAWWLLALLFIFMVSTESGRRQLGSSDALYAITIIVALAMPWLVWILRTGSSGHSPASAFDLAVLRASLANAGWLFIYLLLSAAGVALLVALNSHWFARLRRRSPSGPTILRAGLDPLAKWFVYSFAIAPFILGAVFGGTNEPPAVSAGPGVVLMMVGLAAVVASGDIIVLRRQKVLRQTWAAAVALPAFIVVGIVAILPWFGRTGTPSALPATAVARFFAENFERRTGRNLPAVAGDAELAALVALGPSRPHLLRADAPERTPWISPASFVDTGGVVVWRASDTAGAPPPEIAQRFPGLVPEVPRAFDHLLNGRRPPPRIGWAIVRPKAS